MQGKRVSLLFEHRSSIPSSRKRALAHIARASERYFSDDPKIIAEIEELEVEYLFKYAFTLVVISVVEIVSLLVTSAI